MKALTIFQKTCPKSFIISYQGSSYLTYFQGRHQMFLFEQLLFSIEHF